MHTPRDNMLDAFLKAVPERSRDSSLWVAYSGGADSTALLHGLRQLQIPDLRAVHIHHGLQQRADDWEMHCHRFCRRIGVPLKSVRAEVRASGTGVEAAAREARYAAIAECMKPGDVLATAHHQDDQAETFLLALMRGAHVNGLSAMPGLRDFGPGCLWRPLLDCPRQVILDYVAKHELAFVEDPQNNDLRFSRALLRQQVLPQLRTQWPQVKQRLAQTAAEMAQTAQLLEQIALQDLRQLSGDGAEVPACLPAAALRQLTAVRRNNLVRGWVRASGLPRPPAAVLARIHAELLDAGGDRNPCLRWNGAEWRRYRDQVFLMPNLAPIPKLWQVPWSGQCPLILPASAGTVHAHGGAGRRNWTVRFVQGGERFRPHGKRRLRSLKNLFQEAGIPPWIRQRTPLIEDETGVRWVGGLGRGEPPLPRVKMNWQTNLVGVTCPTCH